MSQSATEGQQQNGQQQNGQQGAGDQGQQQGDQGQQNGQQQGQAGAGQNGNGAGQQQNQGGQSNGQQQGQQQNQGADDGLTDEERNALSDPGRRALERVREERNTARTELETTQGQLREALAKLGEGGDQQLQQQVTDATTRAETAERSVLQYTALMRNGLAVPRQGETGEQFAARMSQLAGMLQGTDQAQLDASAAVLASLGTGQQGNGQQQRVTTGDAHQAGQGQGQSGKPSMDDAIRAMAGRKVQQ